MNRVDTPGSEMGRLEMTKVECRNQRRLADNGCCDYVSIFRVIAHLRDQVLVFLHARVRKSGLKLAFENRPPKSVATRACAQECGRLQRESGQTISDSKVEVLR